MLRFSAVGLTMLVFLGICSATLDPDLDEAWRQWKTTHSKVYRDSSEEGLRRSIWESSWKRIEQHNREAAAGRYTFTLGVNQFSDLTDEEITRFVFGCRS